MTHAVVSANAARMAKPPSTNAMGTTATTKPKMANQFQILDGKDILLILSPFKRSL